MLRNTLKLWLVSLTASIDIIITLVILSHGTHWELVEEALANYKFLTSFVELLSFSVLRAAIIFGGVVGLLLRKWTKSDNLFAMSYSLSIVATCLYYTAIKVLICSGYPSFHTVSTVWFWSLLGWNFAGCFLFSFLWYYLSVIQDELQIQQPHSSVLVTETADEPLLENGECKSYKIL